MTFDRLAARARALPPIVADLLVVAVVGAFTTADAAVNEPGYRQADALTWTLLAVSLAALVCRRRWPVPVVCVTGAACAGWALHGHIGELLNLPVIVALYTVAVLGDRRRTLWTGVIAATVSGAVALKVGRDVVNPQGCRSWRWSGRSFRCSWARWCGPAGSCWRSTRRAPPGPRRTGNGRPPAGSARSGCGWPGRSTTSSPTR
ncbi:hypothetical protein ABZ592_12030 [Streptomyces fimicarius]|uniref:DUF7134 domain-containing protein n=1 Tax=Streptomyces griseus TaxID=1911 RepID=UPI0033E398DB